MSILSPNPRVHLPDERGSLGAHHLGIDVGGTKTDVVLVRGDAVVDRMTVATERGNARVFRTVTALIHSLLTRNSLTPSDLGNFGVGIPGAIDAHGVVHNAVNLDIKEMPLGTLLHQHLRRPVVIENDVNASAVGLHRQLRLSRASSLAFVNLGTGLAAGLVLRGELWRGATGGAGEIGHIPLWGETAVCACGQAGCAELLASGSGLYHRYGVGPLTPAALDELARATTHALLSLLLTLDVDVLVLGGGVVTHNPDLFGRIADVSAVAATASPLLRSYDLAGRLLPAPNHVPIGALGAALLGGVRQ